MRRIAKADPWEYVMRTYGGLIKYYAKMYAKWQSEKRGDYYSCLQDFESDIRFNMVKVYTRYYFERELPLRDVTKMIKSVPYYYYWNVILKKDNSAPFVDEQVIEFYPESISEKHKNVCEVGDIAQLFDYYFELFIDHAYKLKDEFKITDEYLVLKEILAPSEEYREFAKQYKRFMSVSALKEFFKKTKNWTESRFIYTMKDMKNKVEVFLAA
jgi:hypothetical protein